jgi:hypothetical protein
VRDRPAPSCPGCVIHLAKLVCYAIMLFVLSTPAGY